MSCLGKQVEELGHAVTLRTRLLILALGSRKIQMGPDEAAEADMMRLKMDVDPGTGDVVAWVEPRHQIVDSPIAEQ